MQVSSIQNFRQNLHKNSQKNNIKFSQNFFTIPFTAMKKSEFSGIDLFVVESEKSPIEKFNSNKDFQDWARQKTIDLFNKDYEGRKPETKNARYEALYEWMKYFVLFDQNNKYSPATRLMAIHSITSNLKPNEDKLPPNFNRDAFKATIDEINQRLELNPKDKFSFSKIYRKNLFLTLGIGQNTDPYAPHWIHIQSKIHDPEHYEQNVKKLEAVSDLWWCTAYRSHSTWYLSDKDMHIYVENLQPKVAIVTTADNVLWELQGKWNNHVPPIEYMDNIVYPYMKANNIKNKGRWLYEDTETGFKNLIKNYHQTVDTNNIQEIFKFLGIEAEKDETDGLYVISHYGTHKAKDNERYHQHFEDFGIDENELFKHIKEIKNHANFVDTNVTDLGSLKRIGGNACFFVSKLHSLGNLEYIGGDAVFKDSMISDLGNLQEIGNDVEFKNSIVTSLGKLKRIGGNADFHDSFITSLENLEEVGGLLIICNAQISDIGNLKRIGYALVGNMQGLEIKNCDKLEYIGEGGALIHNPKDFEILKQISKGEVLYFEPRPGN
jgi:hypothetical protein